MTKLLLRKSKSFYENLKEATLRKLKFEVLNSVEI